ncbi:MAG: hypothetical protein JXR94_07220 [Candidatus Hydrogenedentes bacterium]|nr:hypothetical protein [Candidatus Hydrogenedentota bacterium]
MGRRGFLAVLAAPAAAAAATAAGQSEGKGVKRIARVPKPAGDWSRIAPSPDLPEIGSAPGDVVDHALFRAANGNWQLWMQIRDTSVGRLFYRWEGGAEFARTDWTPHGICWRADRDCGESWDTGGQDFVHAPHVILNDGRYAMYYGGGPSPNGGAQIGIATSTDGITFERVTDEAGRSEAFAGPGYARDPMVIEVDGRYLMYYAADEDGRGVIALRTAERAYGAPWSDYRVVSQGGLCGTGKADQQCPFVVFMDGYYYLFKMGASTRYETAVLRSEDPYDFGEEDERLVTVLEASASEVIEADGRWYISSLIPGYEGVRIRPIEWAIQD